MKRTINDVIGEVILSYQENSFQEVLDEFSNAKFINIVTYNINTYEINTELIKELRKVDSSIPITLILNIPARRQEYINNYTGVIDQVAIKSAQRKIKYTLNVLEREKFGDLTVYFNFDNHAKLIMTDNFAYIGSQNFSDKSQGNFELGILIKESSAISKIKVTIFETIKSRSIRYTTSKYTILMEEMEKLMKDSLKDIRQNIFSLVGDEPYGREKEILDIENAHFQREKWEEFKDLHFRYEDIVKDLINDYPDKFNKVKAETLISQLRKMVESFVFELDELANFTNNRADFMMWENFHQNDTGEENMNETLDNAMNHVRNYKHEEFFNVENQGEKLIKTFDGIEECIKKIETTIDEIKDAMIKTSVYQNIELIKNYIMKN